MTARMSATTKNLKILKLIPKQTNKDGELVCAICHKPMAEYTLDHIIPIAKGGSNGLLNLQLTHNACNKNKKDKLNSKQVAAMYGKYGIEYSVRD